MEQDITKLISTLTEKLKQLTATYTSKDEIVPRATYLFIGCGKDAKINAKHILDYLKTKERSEGLFSRLLSQKKYGRQEHVKLFSEFTVFEVFAAINILYEAGFQSELLTEMAKLLKALCYKHLHGFATMDVLNEYSSNLLKGNKVLKEILKDRLRSDLPIDDVREELIDKAILGATTISMDAISMDISDIVKSIQYYG